MNDSFVILDEAQNTTSEQMKMFVTRLGFNSKAVITGDVTQIDLPNARRSGLLEAVDILKHVEGLTFVYFDEGDVVRHHLVQRIIRAYDEHKTKLAEQQMSLLEPKGTNGKTNGVDSAPLPKNICRACGSRRERVKRARLAGRAAVMALLFIWMQLPRRELGHHSRTSGWVDRGGAGEICDAGATGGRASRGRQCAGDQ